MKVINLSKWLTVVLISTLFLSCNTKYEVKVNVPNSVCGHAFILIEKSTMDDHFVRLDKDGVGVLKIKTDIDPFGNMFEYAVMRNGKDITEECSEFVIVSSHSNFKEKYYLSFVMQCETLEEAGPFYRNVRFEQIEDNPKIKKWNDNGIEKK